MSEILNYARKVLQDAIDRIDKGECHETEVSHVLNKINAHSQGFYSEQSLVNYDEAMRILNIGNRAQLQETLRKHNVQMVKMKNRKMGFLRDEVEALALELNNPHVNKRRPSNF